MVYRRYQNDRYTQDGRVWDEGGQWKWFNSNQDESIVVGEYKVFRMTIDVPKNSTISSATFQTEYIVKNGDAFPQSFSYDAGMEINAAPYPEANDVFIGPVGTFPVWPRRRVRAMVSGTVNYTSNTPAADVVSINVTNCLQEVVSDPEYYPGQAVSVFLKATAETGDISLRTRDHAWSAPPPNLQVNFTPPTTDIRRDVNFLPNHTIEQDTELWFHSDAYGYYAAGQTGVRSTDTAHTGSYSLKVTGGATDGTKSMGLMSQFSASPNTSYVFCGWVYVPSSNPLTFEPQFQYVTGGTRITTKNQWVPFCTNPITQGAEPGTIWPAVSCTGGSSTAYSFYVDSMALVESKFMQFPFTGYMSAAHGKEYEFPQTNLKGSSLRTTRARTKVNGVTGTRWTKRSDGIWVRGESERQSGTASDFVGLGDTVQSLANSGKTWNQLENATLY